MMRPPSAAKPMMTPSKNINLDYEEDYEEGFEAEESGEAQM